MWGDCIGDHYRVIKGDTRSLDYSSCGFGRMVAAYMAPT